MIELNRSKENESFNLKISEKDLGKLYNVLKIDFIDTEITTLKDFINVLLKPWKFHNSIILYHKIKRAPRLWELFCNNQFIENY